MTVQATIEGFRVSSQQHHLWRLGEGGVEPRLQAAVLLTGAVRDEALRAALRDLVERNEILRTTFQTLPGVEVPLQVIGEGAGPDLREVRAGEAGPDLEARIEQELAAERLRPFDLRRGPLARFVLLHGTGGERVLLVSLSALVADPLSLDNLLDQLARAYAARAAGADPDFEPLQYADFSEWQGALEEEAEAGRAHWARLCPALSGGDPLEPFENATRSPGESAGFHPERLARPLDPALALAAADLAGALGVPLATVLLAAWCAAVRRLGGGEGEVRVGALVDGRPLAPLREGIGPFARYVPVVCRLEEHFGFAEAVRTAGEALRESAAHQQSFSPEELGVGSLPILFDFREIPAAGSVHFSLLGESAVLDRFRARLSAVAREGVLSLELSTDPAFYTREDAALLLERGETLLRAALADPERPLGDLDVASEAERRRVLVEWNRTDREVPWEGPFHRLFERQAERTPDAPALLAGDLAMTYRELDRRAGQLAAHLRRLGVGLDTRVALCLDRSPDLVVSALAVLKSGGAFVPLDPAQPKERLGFLLEEVEARAVLTGPRSLPLLPDGAPALVLEESLFAGEAGIESALSDPEACAYAIFTSGSTGRPKGVLVRQGSLVNLIAALDDAVYDGAGGPLRVSLNAPLSFDASIKQLVQLARGHALCLVPEEIRADGGALLAFLREKRVDVLDCTPTQLRLLLEAGLASTEAPRLLLVGGEAVDLALWQTLAADPGRRFVDVYGPTECTVDSTACRIAPGTPAIGRPLANVRVYVLDDRLRPVPAGAAGELFIGGAGLARGYARRPDLTAERFLPDPFSGAAGARLYRTGDRVRHRPDGALEFLGRVDHQIKLRGFRIEPGEIEEVLAEHPAVEAAVVEAREDPPGHRRLVAYVVPKRSRAGRAGSGRRRRLPNGMAVVEQNRNETDYLYREIFENRCYVSHGIRLPEAPVVVDVGANIGMFSLFVARHRPKARIYAFEPLAPLFATLQANTGLHAPQARLFPIGLAERERREAFTFYPRYTMMSGRSASADAAGEVEVIKRFLANSRDAELLEHADELLAGRFEGEVHEVRLRRLSDVLCEQGIERIDLLKVDVQRAEMDVLAGLDAADWARVQQVAMEVHDASGSESEGRLAALTVLLEAHGFTVSTEQDALLTGTDRHNLYAVRPGVAGSEIGAAEAVAPVAEEGEELSAAGLRELARRRLPEVMVPAAIVLLDELPLTRNGKVDRAALPAPEEAAGAPATVAPRNPFEEMMATIWAEVLGVHEVGADSDFFDLGGHSLLATQLMSRVREVFEVELPLRSLFEAPTVAGLAQRAEEAIRAANGLLAPPILPVPRGGELPLSFAQQRLWFLDQLEPESAFYITSHALWLDGPLAVAVLERTLTEVVRRHEVLRTAFPAEGGRAAQRIAPPERLAMPRVDLSALPAAAGGEEVLRLAAEDARRPFDLARAPLLRVTLLRLAAGRHALFFGMHHIACDAWSLGLLVREVGTLYQAFREGRPSPLPELPVQYADFSHWQRHWLRGETLEAHLGYWRRRLATPLPRLLLPGERERPAAPGYRGGRAAFLLSPELSAALGELARAHGATLFMTLLAGFKATLARLTGQEDLIVGTAIAGRNRLETEGLIGFFINMLPLRTDLSGNPTFLEILARVREVALGAYAHQDLPFDKLVEELQPERDSGAAPFFRVAFGFQNAPVDELVLPELRFTAIPVESEAVRFDLTIWAWEQDGRLKLQWTYSAGRFEAAAIERLHGSFAALLESAVASPGARLKDLEAVSAAARDEEERRRREREAANSARLKRVERRSVGGR